jgi:2-polyprenyl-3-methyl-5-hydroxy-6-metoxy-1,4-benzoquinol methylase
LGKEKQKKIFFKVIGRKDECLFHEERLLERDIAKSILTCPTNQRDISYREGYEKLHKFLLSVTEGQSIYRGANLQRALWKQFLFSQIVGKNQRALEVGCGEGLLSIALSKNGNIVTGTDVSDICISIANRNKSLFSAENVNFAVMSASKLDFPKNTFDWVISVDLFEHLHPQDAISHVYEAARVLKPGGKYLLVTPNASVGMHAGNIHIKEYNCKEIMELFSHAGFSSKSPLIYYAWPFSFLADIKVKLFFQRFLNNQSFLYILMCLDPIILVATRHGYA